MPPAFSSSLAARSVAARHASAPAAPMADHLPPRSVSQTHADLARSALVVQLVACAWGVEARAIASLGRCRAEAAQARQIAMYLAHTAFGWPLVRVGQAFGRDRTTVGHACQKVEDARDDAGFDARIAALETCLQAAPAAAKSPEAGAKGASWT